MSGPRFRNDDVPTETIDYIITRSTGGIHYQVEQNLHEGTRWMTDVVTPGAKRKLAEGQIINNPMSYEVKTRTHGELPVQYISWVKSAPEVIYTVESGNTTDQFLTNVYSIWIENPVEPLDTIGHLTNVAQQKCLAFVDRTPVALAEDLGEIRETVRFLKNPIRGLQRLVNTFVGDKRQLSKIKNRYERAQAIADIWNTYRFAAAPLMRSVVDILELAAHKPPNRPKRRRSSGRTKDSAVSSAPKSVRATPSLYNQVIEYHLEGYWELNIHATILYEVSNPLVDWKYKLGLRLKDLPTTAWELLPLSFMVDRLLDIRSFFAGTMNLLDPNVTFLAGSVSERLLDQHTVSLVERKHALWTHVISRPDIIQYEIFRLERSIWNPSFSDTIPGLTPGGLVKDLTSIMDLLAIMLSLMPSVNSNSPYRP